MQGAGAAGVAFIGAEYLCLVLLPASRARPPRCWPARATLMGVLLALNCAGIRTGATHAERAVALEDRDDPRASRSRRCCSPRPPACGRWRRPPPSAATLAGSLGGGGPVFYAYGGYQCAMNLARRRPRAAAQPADRDHAAAWSSSWRSTSRSTRRYERALGLDGVADSQLVAAALARATLGPVGETVVSLAIFLSAAGFVNATILQMPRSYYAMAEDGALPRAFLRVDPQHAGAARRARVLRAHHAGAGASRWARSRSC